MGKSTFHTGANVNRSPSNCTAMHPSGRFCDSESIEGAPFPICRHHAVSVFMFMRHDLVARTGDAGAIEVMAASTDRTEMLAKRMAYKPETEYVYYVAVGDHIKIGYTADLKQRMLAYTTGTMLAVEPGGDSLERIRLKQFRADLASGREWFRRSMTLIQHIDRLNEKHPIPSGVRKAPSQPARSYH